MELEVDALMHTAEAGTVAEVGSHFAGNRMEVAGEVKFLGVGDLHPGVGIDVRAIPGRRVDVVEFGLFALGNGAAEGFVGIDAEFVAKRPLIGQQVFMLGVVRIGKFELS